MVVFCYGMAPDILSSQIARAILISLMSNESAGGNEGGLLTHQRRERITELLALHGVVRVKDLSSRFGVSEVTIRTDLDQLAHQGTLVRDHGGAIANTVSPLSVGFAQRALINQEVKQAIGRAAAEMVSPGDSIMIDAGSTAMEMAKQLSNHAPLTVITNALNVATQVGALPAVNVILAGGSLSRETISTLGTLAERDLSGLMVNKAFISAPAVDVDRGLTDPSIEVARVKMAMIQAAREVILLADSSKWGQQKLAKIANLAEVQTVISDEGLPQETRRKLLAMGINLVLV